MKHQFMLSGFDPNAREAVQQMTLAEKVQHAIELLKENEPEEGYYLAFSGGKDSCVIKELARMSGVKFDAWYGQTTIDPPELIRFIKRHHADVKWEIPKYGNMIKRVEYNGLPTRFMRWCCREFKEGGGKDRVCIFGVRAAESKARAIRWKEITPTQFNRTAICPIVYWDDSEVWEFIKSNNVQYCELYDEGMKRLGCVGCPLASEGQRMDQFKRWPNFERNWKNSARKYWESHRTQVLRSGKLNFCSRFKTFDEYWNWWMTDTMPDVMRDECQTGHLWANEENEV